MPVEMKTHRIVLMFLAGFLAALPLRAQESACPKNARPDCPRALVFFHGVQAALRSNDRAALAGMMEYPALTMIAHKKTHIANREQLLQHFDEIFNAGVRCAVVNAGDGDVWGNDNGYMVGNGALWFDAVLPAGVNIDARAPDFWTKYPFKIKTVNNDAAPSCAAEKR